MNKINWAQKLSSRKFQVCIVGIIVPICVLLGVKDDTKVQIVSLVTAMLSGVAFIFAEAHVDAARESSIFNIPLSEDVVEDIEQ